MTTGGDEQTRRRDHQWIVAVVLAVGLAVALNLFTFAVLYEALFHTSESGVSENATQILTGWGGGIVGIIGAYVGYQAGTKVAGERKQN
jgi:hypothetical protein